MMSLLRISLVYLLISLPAFAASENKMTEAYKQFQKGAYAQALEIANKVSDKEDAELAFFKATVQAKMQAFDQAAPQFQKAIELGSKAESVYYDYGQALFATQKLKEAVKQFKQSIVKGFKISASAYYIAYISQLLEDSATAKNFYQRIQKLSDDSDKVKQPALFQLAEMENERAGKIENKNKRIYALREQVLPLYKKAENFDSGSSVGEQAEAKIKEIEGILAANVETMANGIPLPLKPYTLKLSQDVTYDTNVSTTPDNPITVVSNNDSIVFKTGVLAKYQFNWRRRWSFTPEFIGSYTIHHRQNTPVVYQNDNASLAPAFRTKYEHMSRGKAASGIMEAEFNLALRDYLKAHQLPYYSRYWNFILGERVNWFSTGSTTVKLSIKLFESYNPEKNSYSPTFSFQQNIKIFGKYDLSNTFTADYLHARNDVNDEKNYKISSSVTFTKLFEKIDVTPSFSFSVKDTMKQKGTRGNEKNFNPALGFAREFGSFDTGFDYAYTRNTSLDTQTYEYKKHEFKLSGGYRF